MSFRQSYANLKPIATIVIVIANDSTLRHPTLSVITSRVKLFGACKLRPKATHSIYQKVEQSCNSRIL